MTVGEYEERLRVPARSLHQIFADMQSPKRVRLRRRRRMAAAAFLAMVVLTADMASHHIPANFEERSFNVLAREVWHILDRVSRPLERLVDHAESFLRDARA